MADFAEQSSNDARLTLLDHTTSRMLTVYENSMSIRMVLLLIARCVPSLSRAPAHGRRSIAGVHQSLRYWMAGTAGSNHSRFGDESSVWAQLLHVNVLSFVKNAVWRSGCEKLLALKLKKYLAELLLFHSLTEHMAHLCSPHKTILSMCSEEKENKKWYACARLFVLLSFSYLCVNVNSRRTNFTGGF